MVAELSGGVYTYAESSTANNMLCSPAGVILHHQSSQNTGQLTQYFDNFVQAVQQLTTFTAAL